MSSAILTLVVASFVGVLGLLAQMARKSHGADVTLIVVILALSVLIAAVGTLTGIGLFLMAANEPPQGLDRLTFVVAGGAALVVGVVGVALCVPPLRRITGRRVGSAFWADPPTFLAVWLFVMVLGNNAVSLLLFNQLPNVENLFPSDRLSPTAILTSQLPFVAVAVLGVGLGVRRSVRETLDRLGYSPISPRSLAVVVLFVGVALALSVGTDALFAQLQPDLYQQVGEISENLFNPAGMGPVEVILFSLLVGVGAGLGEETLFRGAVQPKLGIAATSVLFASMHVQYGPSLLLGYVFLLSVGLGLLRKHVNTTASFLAHAAYNALAILLAYFFA